jgi:hypothetical protein
MDATQGEGQAGFVWKRPDDSRSRRTDDPGRHSRSAARDPTSFRDWSDADAMARDRWTAPKTDSLPATRSGGSEEDGGGCRLNPEIDLKRNNKIQFTFREPREIANQRFPYFSPLTENGNRKLRTGRESRPGMEPSCHEAMTKNTEAAGCRKTSVFRLEGNPELGWPSATVKRKYGWISTPRRGVPHREGGLATSWQCRDSPRPSQTSPIHKYWCHAGDPVDT